MAVRNKVDFLDPQFNEYVLQWLLNLSPDQIQHLSAEDLKKIEKGPRLRRFVGQSTLDEKFLLLAKTGLSMYIIFSPRKTWKQVTHLKDFFKEYFLNPANEKVKRAEAVDGLIKNKVFVLGSPAILLASHYLHQNCQSDFWRINRTFQKTYNMWEMAGKNLGKFRTLSDVSEVAKGADLLIEMSYKIKKFHGLFANLGLSSDLDSQILLFLMRKNGKMDNRASFIEQHALFHELNEGRFSPETLGRRLLWLTENGFIHKNDKVKPFCSYAIADRGVLVVMEYIKIMSDKVNVDL